MVPQIKTGFGEGRDTKLTGEVKSQFHFPGEDFGLAVEVEMGCLKGLW